VPTLAPPPPPITQAEVDALIAKLGDNNFNVRQQAQADLEARAAESADNAYLIVARLKAIGLPSTDLEIAGRSDTILKDVSPLGALSISIDDRTERLAGTSDGNNRGTVITIQPGPDEELRIRDPFFDQFVGPTKTVAFIEAGRQKVGNMTPVSDVIFFEAILGGGNRLVFMSDGENPDLSPLVDCTNPIIVCMNETGGFQDVAGAIFGDKKAFTRIMIASDAEAPEPSTILLVTPGILGLLVYRARRRKSLVRASTA
jgi:hypothetical protein